MNSNTHSGNGSGRPPDPPTAAASVQQPTKPPVQPPDELTALVADLAVVAAQDPDRLTDTALTEEVQELRRLADRLDGQWLKELAAVDARGAAGAEQGVQFGSTAA